MWFGKDEEQAAIAKRLLERPAGTEVGVVADRIPKVACLRPITDPTMQAEVLTLARSGLALGTGKARGDTAIMDTLIPWLHLAPGMAEYRSGRFAEASATLAAISAMISKETRRPMLLKGTADFYLAMCLFRQGKADEARALFTATEATMKPLPTDEQNTLLKAALADDLILWLAFKEAKALLIAPKSEEK